MKKKICFICPKFLDYIGGVETHGYEFARWFSNHPNYEIVSIITRKDVTDGIKVERGEDSIFKTKIIPCLTTNFEKDLKLILKNSPSDTDVYFFNNPSWIPIFERLRQSRINAKIIVRSGGTDFVAGWIGDETDSSRNMSKNKELMTYVINNFTDYLIVNSKFSKRRLLNMGIKRQKMLVLTGGVDCTRYFLIKKKIDSNITVLNASRFVKCKGLDLTIKVFHKALHKSKKNMQLVLVGDGPERIFLEREAKRLKISDRVTFVGAVKIENVSDYFNHADIFLHLPIKIIKKERGGQYEHVESMGRAFCEAAAAGIPSIGFLVGGVPEVVEDKKTGFLLKENDLNGAVRKLVLLAENFNLRNKLGFNARKKALNSFDWKVIFSQYEDLFVK